MSRLTDSSTSKNSSFRRYLMPSRRHPIWPVTCDVIWLVSSRLCSKTVNTNVNCRQQNCCVVNVFSTENWFHVMFPYLRIYSLKLLFFLTWDFISCYMYVFSSESLLLVVLYFFTWHFTFVLPFLTRDFTPCYTKLSHLRFYPLLCNTCKYFLTRDITPWCVIFLPEILLLAV